MGRKSRKKREGRGKGPSQPVPVVRHQVGPLVMEQIGRFVRMRSLLNEEGAHDLRAQMRSGAPNLKITIDREIAELAQICRRVNVFELLYMSSLKNCAGDPETYTESTSEGFEAHAEYLLSVVLAVGKPNLEANASADELIRVHDLIKSIFMNASWYFHSADLNEDNLDDPLTELRHDVRDANMTIRGHSYAQHHLDLLRQVFEPHDVFFRERFSFTAKECLDGFVELGAQINKGFAQMIAFAGQIRELLARYPDLLTKINEESAGLSSGESQALQELMTFRQEMHAESPFEVRANDKLTAALLDKVSSAWGDNSAFLDSPKWPGWPTNPTVVTEKPVIRHEGRHFCFVPQVVLRNALETLDGWIKESDKEYYDNKYQKARGSVLERLALEHLSALLPGCQRHQGLFYTTIDRGVAIRTELDGLILFDDVLFLVEAKSGLFSRPARRGAAERVKKHVQELVDDSYRQAKRAREFVGSVEQADFFDERGNKVVSVRGSDFRAMYLVNVTLDCEERILTHLNSLRACSLLKGEDWPWTVFINDLRVISEILESPGEFLLYLDRRIRANDIPQFAVFDELDYLMHFLRDGLFLEDVLHGEYDRIGLSGYTELLDRYYDFKADLVSSGEKPRFAIGEPLRAFVRRIEACGCKGASGVGARLMMYDASERDTAVFQIQRIVSDCLADGKQHDVTLAGNGRHGIAIVAIRENASRLMPQLEDFARLRQYEVGAPIYDLVILQPKSNGEYDLMVKVLRGCPDSSPNLDRRVQEVRDLRYKRSISSGTEPERNDRCPCKSGKKYKKCHGA